MSAFIKRMRQRHARPDERTVTAMQPRSKPREVTLTLPAPMARALVELLSEALNTSMAERSITEAPVERTLVELLGDVLSTATGERPMKQASSPAARTAESDCSAKCEQPKAQSEIRGVLLECGHKPDPRYGKSRYQVLIREFDTQLPNQQYGVDLERAVAQANVQPGDLIALEFLGTAVCQGEYKKKIFNIRRLARRR